MKLARELEASRRRVHALEAELRRGKRQAQPFGRGARTDSPRRPGRKKGEGTFGHRKPPPEEKTETVNVPLDRCPCCGGPLSDKKTHEHFQTDLPRPEPKHTRFINESGWCGKCKRRVRSRHPEQASTASGAAGTSVGPHAKAVAADLHHRLGVPYAKVAEHLAVSAGLDVTPGALAQANERLAAKLMPVYEGLIDAICKACAVHVDETGWRVGTLSAWLWVFTSERVTVYVVDRSRSHEVVMRVLGRDFKGTLVSDCFLAYDHADLADWIKQKCLAHLLKDLDAMESEKTRGAIRFPRNVKRLLLDALALREEKPNLTRSQFESRLDTIERRLDALISAKRNFTDPDNARFAKRLRKQRRHLLTFLTRDGVEPTNNRAERDLRPAVVSRKTGGCNKTSQGAAAHAVNAGILATARKNGINPVEYVTDVLLAPPGAGLPLPLPAAARDSP